jgi:hypothetical protein
MAELYYQHGATAARDRLAQGKLKWFGPSCSDVWRVLADELPARFDESTWWKGPRVVAAAGPWEVVLDLHRVDKVVFTRIRAPYVNADGFRFHVFRKHFFSGVAEWAGFQDVSIGDPLFDDAFVIRGTDESKLRRLFAAPRLRELLLAQPSIAFRVLDDDGRLFGSRFPAGVDQLQFITGGVIKDLDRLKLLYDLFAETLQELCRMGSAYEDDPGVTL